METEVKKPSTGARIGYFFLALVPTVLCLILQVMALVVMCIILAVGKFATGELDATAPDYLTKISALMMDAAPSGVTLYHIIGILFFGLWFKLCFKKPRPTIRKSFAKVTKESVVLAVLFGLVLCLFANSSVMVEYHLIPNVVNAYMEMAETAGLGGDSLMMLFTTVIMAPIGEEFLCRGVTMHFAQKAFGKFWLANILQAVMFGCIHGNWVQGIYAFVIGLVLGWLVRKYDSLVPAMLLHFVVNASSSSWAPWMINSLYGEDMPSLPVGLIWLAVTSAAAIAILVYKEKKDRENLNSTT